jgi:hypothetical protein
MSCEPVDEEVGDGESLFVLDDVGRSLHPIPGTDSFSFLHKQDWDWWIRSFDPATGGIMPLAPISQTNEDYCWTPDGTMLTLDGSTLLRFRPGRSQSWETAVELGAEGFDNGGRCAVSPDGRYLAVGRPAGMTHRWRAQRRTYPYRAVPGEQARGSRRPPRGFVTGSAGPERVRPHHRFQDR